MPAAPTTASAMKAVLTQERFSDPEWIYERKLDGIRCIAIRDGDTVKLLSRNDLSLNGRYPGVVADLEAEACTRFAIDGEIVAFEGTRTSFQALGHHDASIFYYVFDLLWLDGEDVRDRPLRERKALLKNALNFQGHVRWTAFREEAGEAMFAEACANGWEGVIAKRASSLYTDKRSKDCLKFKCEQGQELVIGGFTAPRGSREEFGALLVGHFEPGGTLRYAGKVGTGFDRETLKDLGARLRELTRDTTPFADSPNYRDATWVEPELVAQLGFSEWTTAGRLRHPRFQGLRFDKAAREVVREAPR
ncbi:non-homologous end-joining DNA ligase [Solirubrobacter ginsenosidimutans]|uniref:DNA ligase (ATP) n=1 Tax=Solirubrobacter ginsenosidimutans TaxID=490573 RepID=A0A9X3S4F4_9ACTN|nr:non-homologous end-joining DNA ligase [Solirubrobacter ginsenosidimutans]MDA0163021.1 non-homologous end-joining DNA ligase [Solirubrobacter ginsenosidimutans]